jgi:hypothetical protein
MRAKDGYQWHLVKSILERHVVSPTDFVPYRNFFQEISARRTLAMDKEAQKIRVGQIKAKYEKWGLKPTVLKEIAKLVPLKVRFPD